MDLRAGLRGSETCIHKVSTKRWGDGQPMAPSANHYGPSQTINAT